MNLNGPGEYPGFCFGKTEINRDTMGQHLTLPVCSGGWNARDPLDQMPITDAIVFDNIVHTGGADVVRKGYALFSNNDTESGTKQYDFLFSYNAGDDSRVIAIQGNVIKSFDLNGVLKLTDTIGEGTANFRTGQFTDGAGQIHLFIVRGNNNIWDFAVVDGVDSLTISTLDDVSDPNIVAVFSYKNRPYFIEQDSFNIWYGDVQAIGGQLTRFFVGSFFKKSSRILALGAWTQDGGNGPDDQLCIFSENGEVLIYSGLSPNDTNGWNLVGRYDIEKPINDRCVVQIKGDLVIGTHAGYIPLSSVLSELSANKVALSGKINPYVKAKNMGNVIWNIDYWSAQGRLIVNAPSSEQSLLSEYHIYNFENNTWSRFLGQNSRDFTIVADRKFFCRDDGIWEDNVGYKDNSAPIKWRKQSGYSDYGLKYKKKIMRWIPRIESVSIPDLYKFVWTDFTRSAKTFVFDNIADDVSGAEAKWDSSKWEQSKWVDLTGKMFSIKSGIAHSPAVYISLGLWGESISETRVLSTDLIAVVGHGTL